MKLGEIIREYRLNNRMSMGDFAKMSGISKPYISMLEANKNSNGGKPIAPSVETLQKVARTVGISLDELLRKLGDEKIDLRSSIFDEDELSILNGYRALNPEGKNLVKGMIIQLNISKPLSASGDNHSVTQKKINNNGVNIVNVGNSHFKQNVTAK